ncbi:unnamed protein product, partial [Pylaiella littoralis]
QRQRSAGVLCRECVLCFVLQCCLKQIQKGVTKPRRVQLHCSRRVQKAPQGIQHVGCWVPRRTSGLPCVCQRSSVSCIHSGQTPDSWAGLQITSKYFEVR